MSYKNIIGHARQIEQLKLIKSRLLLSNAYLFTGVQGIGKRLVAKEFIKSFFCQIDPCDNCNACKKISNDLHENVKTVNAESGTISIVQSREISRFFSLKSDSYRFVLINDAHTLTEEAQNALLKILEEPPCKTSIILITPFSGSLLETVRSRCKIVHFSPLPRNVIMEVVNKEYRLPKEGLDLIYFLSGGSLAQALQLAPSYTELQKEVSLIVDKIEKKDFNYLVETYGKGKSTEESREKARFLFNVLILNGVEQLNSSSVSIIEAILNGQNALDQNTNVTLTLENTLIKCERNE